MNYHNLDAYRYVNILYETYYKRVASLHHGGIYIVDAHFSTNKCLDSFFKKRN